PWSWPVASSATLVHHQPLEPGCWFSRTIGLFSGLTTLEPATVLSAVVTTDITMTPSRPLKRRRTCALAYVSPDLIHTSKISARASTHLMITDNLFMLSRFIPEQGRETVAALARCHAWVGL